MKDEWIQKQVEAGQAPEGQEGELYKIVFSALKQEAGFKLPSDFAGRVAAAATRPAKSFNWDLFFLVFGCTLCVTTSLYVIITSHATLSVGVFSFFSGYRWLIGFALLFIGLLNWVDKKWISKAAIH
ncbi:MAG: hypothetical protein OJF59_000750 [Cytophagales bacterium]|jgi:hypothetical protein|nr:hypothetical protein [Bacteroidota bacterium]MBS1979742.1 hypothetical protein [Bacteroidota bacterium]WHZ06997.1 MAG: hypothetical protein OJF59_000750 [Cytophagales bacterium]